MKKLQVEHFDRLSVAGWKVEKLTDVFELRPPKKEAREQLSENVLVSFLPMEDLDVFQRDVIAVKEKTLKEVSASYTYFANNDVLLAKITPCFENGKLGIARNLKNGVGFGSSEYIVFRSKGEVTPEFLFYYLARDEFRTKGEKAMTGAAGQKRVPPSFVESLEISYPPLPEQQRIVSLLDETFAGLAQVHANAERNLVNAREVFESYLESVFEGKKEWKKLKISDFCKSIVDCVNRTAPLSDKETPYKMIRTTNIRYGKVDLSSVRYVDGKTYKEWTRRQKPERGDILFTREAPMGEAGMLLSDDDVFLGQRIVSYRVDESKADKSFVLYQFQSGEIKKQINKLASGATVQHLRVPHTKEFIFSIPPLEEQRAIVQRLDGLAAETSRLEAVYQSRLEAVEELRKSVLKEAFEGRL